MPQNNHELEILTNCQESCFYICTINKYNQALSSILPYNRCVIVLLTLIHYNEK